MSSQRPAAAVAVHDVTHWFVRSSLAEMRPILKNINLTIAAGEFVCLVGPSGCGKTTLLNLVAGVLEPSVGTVTVGLDGVNQPPLSPQIGYMLARDTLLPWRRAHENVQLGLELRRISKRERRRSSLSALEMVGLANASDLYPAELSQGMRQRVNLARTLVTKPSLLLMDEPFGALDAHTRTTMQEEFLRIWQRERSTVVFVTHDLQEAVLLADRVLAMVDGTIVEEITVPFARPRVPEELRYDAGFQSMARHLRKTLERADGSVAEL